MESRVGIGTSTSLEQVVGVVGCCWEGFSEHLHKQQQSAWQGWQELVLLISASVKPLRSFCLHSKVTRWPSHLLWALCVSHTSPGIQNRVSLSEISLSLSLFCAGLQTPHSFLEGLPAQQHKGAFSSRDLAFVPRGLILWCYGCFVPLRLTESLKYKCKCTWMYLVSGGNRMFLAYLKEWRSAVINQHFHRALISLKKSTFPLTLLARSHWSKPHMCSPQQCIPGRLLCQLLANSFVPKTSLLALPAARASGSRGFGKEMWQLDLCGRHEQSTVCSVLSYSCENNTKMMFPEPSFPSNAIIKWPKDKIHVCKKYWQNHHPVQHIHKEFWYFLALFLPQNWEIYKNLHFSTP